MANIFEKFDANINTKQLSEDVKNYEVNGGNTEYEEVPAVTMKLKLKRWNLENLKMVNLWFLFGLRSWLEISKTAISLWTKSWLNHSKFTLLKIYLNHWIVELRLILNLTHNLTTCCSMFTKLLMKLNSNINLNTHSIKKVTVNTRS